MDPLTPRVARRFSSAQSPRLQALIEDARKAGYEIKTEPNGTVAIFRKHKGTGTILQGLLIHPNGTAIDSSVRPDIAKGLRSFGDMRKVLGL